MKMEFSILMQGEDSLKEKFKKAVQSNQNLHIDLIRAFAQSIILALCLNEDDKISVEGFRAGEFAEPPRAEPIPSS